MKIKKNFIHGNAFWNAFCQMAATLSRWRLANSWWPGDATWRRGTRSTLAQVMACCLTAPSHYLNQCWLMIREVPWHSSGCIIIRRSEETNQWNKIESCSFKMASRSPRGQWVNSMGTRTLRSLIATWLLWNFTAVTVNANKGLKPIIIKRSYIQRTVSMRRESIWTYQLSIPNIDNSICQ